MTASRDQDASFYDQRWAAADVSNAKKERGRIISEVIEREANRTLDILELGCGTGWLCNELSRFGNCLGVDLSSVAIEQAKQVFPKPRFMRVDLAEWQPDATYDVVVSHEVLEHLRDQRAHVQVAHRALKPGGLLVLTTPNARSAYGADVEIRHGYDLQPIENWLYMDEARQLIERAGFTIETLTTISTWRSYRNRALRALTSFRADSLAARLGGTEAWARAKGRLGLNGSILAVARRR